MHEQIGAQGQACCRSPTILVLLQMIVWLIGATQATGRGEPSMKYRAAVGEEVGGVDSAERVIDMLLHFTIFCLSFSVLLADRRGSGSTVDRP